MKLLMEITRELFREASKTKGHLIDLTVGEGKSDNARPLHARGETRIFGGSPCIF